MITLKQAFEIAGEDCELELDRNAYDWGDYWLFVYGGKKIITGFYSIAVSKMNGTVKYLSFLEDCKVLSNKLPRVSV